jgi:phage terminase large subunit GpA-like protein
MLRHALDVSYPHEDGGAVPISLAAVDSSDGVTTSEVYAFTRKMGARRAIPVKGRDQLTQAITAGGKVDAQISGKRTGRLKPWLVGSSYLKGEFYGLLRLDRPTTESGAEFPQGYVHLPKHVAGEEFCKQLVAESLQPVKQRSGRIQLKWVKKDANEALDCRVYARAAAVVLGVDRRSDAWWQNLAAAIDKRVVADLPEPDDEDENDEAPPPAAASRPPPPVGVVVGVAAASVTRAGSAGQRLASRLP